MNKVIKGKKYDTELAMKIGCHSDVEDYLWIVNEELYRKDNGEFFLYGEAVCDPDCYDDCFKRYPWVWTGNFLPLSVDQAKEWVERYMTADEYENIFGEVEE